MPQAGRSVGRPRALTLRQIVEAGKAIGLDRLSVSAVAMQLGVGVATIYTYVENRDELHRLVAISLAKRPPIRDEGQHWAEILREVTRYGFDMLSSEPELLRHLVSGSIGPEERMPLIEAIVALLVARGFCVNDAFELARKINQIAEGAAVGKAMARAWEQKGEPRRVKLARALAEAPVGASPNLRQVGAALTDDARYYDYRPLLEQLLAQVASERGEILPPPRDDFRENLRTLS